MATQRQRKAIENVVENGGNVSKGMVKAGYSPKTAKTPQKLTESKAWDELMDVYLSDQELSEKHQALLNATGIAHQVYPLDVTDKQIIDLLKEANCQVKRFMHSETQTHVWYFAPDNRARKDALDMAYKLKGRYQDNPDTTRPVTINVLNFNGKRDNDTISIHPQDIPASVS